jgi:hypothetical protein
MKRYAVFSVRKGKGGESIWVRAGNAVENRDGSINVHLDVLPLDGQLHLRASETVQHEPIAPSAPCDSVSGETRCALPADHSGNHVSGTVAWPQKGAA